uniref:RILP-like protein homolog (inferred by orthology to a D. melanogaster protein) n=1 Tax=Strongyloides venezuelensis TaxID=75913 RepID=A0A0K0FNY2_STRVS
MGDVTEEVTGRPTFKTIVSTTNSSSLSGSPSRHITVIDVYDLASEIGKDFERLAEQYGTDAITGIMPKVISALETLESLAKKNSEESDEVMTLKNTIHILENEKRLRLKERNSFEAELEQIEDNYKKEIMELKGIVKGLQGENRKLSKKINDSFTGSSDNESGIDDCISSKEEDLNMIMSLKEQISVLKDKIKELTSENKLYESENCTLQGLIEKSISQNKELIRKNESLGSQARGLIGEKNEILKAIQKLEIANFELKKQLTETERACQDLETLKKNNNSNLSNGEDAPRFTLRELREVLQEKNTLKARVMELEEHMDEVMKRLTMYEEKEKRDRSKEPSNYQNCMNYNYRCNYVRDSSIDSTSTLSCDIMPDDTHATLTNSNVQIPIQGSSTNPTVVGYEEHVNNSFNSTSTLSTFLSSSVTGRRSTGDFSETQKIHSYTKKLEEEGVVEAIEFCDNQMSDEMLVYGPINKEPEEKLTPWDYERKQSGIKKFFKFFTTSYSSGGNFSSRLPGSSSGNSNPTTEE